MDDLVLVRIEGRTRSLYLERLLAEAREAEAHAARMRKRVQDAADRLARVQAQFPEPDVEPDPVPRVEPVGARPERDRDPWEDLYRGLGVREAGG